MGLTRSEIFTDEQNQLSTLLKAIAHPARIAIRGGSAGGWTVLASLVSSDVFACGVSYYGVADLRGCSTVERGERLIGIAAADHRPALQAAFSAMVARL